MYFHDLSSQTFLTNRQESVFIWQFKIFNKRYVDPFYTIDLTCHSSFSNDSYFVFSSGPAHLRIFEKVVSCETHWSDRRYSTIVPMVCLILFMKNTDSFNVTFCVRPSIKSRGHSQTLICNQNINFKEERITTPLQYSFYFGENASTDCTFERITFSLEMIHDRFIQMNLVIKEMDSYQFGGCIYGSITVAIEDVSPIEICSFWPKLMGESNFTFISTNDEISLILLSFGGMFGVKAEAHLSENVCQGAYLPSEIMLRNINNDGVTIDEENYRHITYFRSKQLFIEPNERSCIVMQIFPREDTPQNISSKNQQYQIHVTTFIDNVKEIPVKKHRAEVNYFMPRMNLNEDHSNECENFGYVFFEERFEKNYKFIAGYDKHITFAKTSLYTVLDIKEGCSVVGFKITITIASADHSDSRVEISGLPLIGREFILGESEEWNKLTYIISIPPREGAYTYRMKKPVFRFQIYYEANDNKKTKCVNGAIIDSFAIQEERFDQSKFRMITYSKIYKQNVTHQNF